LAARPLARGHIDALLPDRDRVSGADTTAAFRPRGLRNPIACGARRQKRAAHDSQEWIVGRWRDRPHPGAQIPRGLEHGLSLRGELHENLSSRGINLKAKTPR